MFGEILFVYLFYLQGTDQDCIHPNDQDCIHPKTTLVLLNHTATLFCYESNTMTTELIIGIGAIDDLVVVGNNTVLEDIQFQKLTTSGDTDGCVNVNYTVTVNATTQTNNTSVQCTFVPGCGATDIALVIVLESMCTETDINYEYHYLSPLSPSHSS